jgi:hypothetical protein
LKEKEDLAKAEKKRERAARKRDLHATRLQCYVRRCQAAKQLRHRRDLVRSQLRNDSTQLVLLTRRLRLFAQLRHALKLQALARGFIMRLRYGDLREQHSAAIRIQVRKLHSMFESPLR